VRDEAVAELLNLVSLPNLQELALINYDDMDIWTLRNALEELPLDDLLLQLHALSLDLNLWLQATFLHPAAVKTLVRIRSDELDNLSTPTIPFVHIRVTECPWKGTPTASLERLASLIESDLSLPVELIYLDHAFHPLSDLPAAVQEAFHNLSQVCQERNIELVVEDGLYDDSEDPEILPSFSERQRERRSTDITVQG
jgi:hypothetical protein